MNYLYDESFAGFLTCVYHHWYTEKADGIFSESRYQLDLTRYATSVETDEEKAERVSDAILRKISKWDAERVYRVFCTNEPEKEMKLLRYIRLGFKHGPRIRLLHGEPVVKSVEAAEQRLGIEVRRLCGLIRFSEVTAEANGRGAHSTSPRALLYARVRPDNDILEFLAPHFADRFKNDPFIITDTRRGKSLFAASGKWQITGASAPSLFVSENETDYRALWKGYFEAMATKERTNPKCQRNFMPARYWDNITELQPD